MHILVVPSAYPSLERPYRGIFYKEQAEALKKQGYKVTVAFPELWSLKALSRPKSKQGYSVTEINGIPTYKISGYNFLPRVPYVDGYLIKERLAKLYKQIVIDQGKPDLIHAHTTFWAGYAAASLSQQEQIPLVITEHSSAFGRKLLKPYQHKLAYTIFKQAEKVIAVGPGLKRELTPYVAEEKLTIIPNVVNVEKFTASDQGSKYKRTDRFNFFSLANLTHNKGMDTLLKAFALSFQGDEHTKLRIGGVGEEKANLEALVKELKLSNQVEFLGNLTRERVAQEMQNCKAFVLASRYETFGVVYIEALASGKPIIATKCGGPEFIVNERNGLLVPVDDIQALAESLQKLKAHYSKYDSREIRLDCESRFSEEVIVRQLREIYTAIRRK